MKNLMNFPKFFNISGKFFVNCTQCVIHKPKTEPLFIAKAGIYGSPALPTASKH